MALIRRSPLPPLLLVVVLAEPVVVQPAAEAVSVVAPAAAVLAEAVAIRVDPVAALEAVRAEEVAAPMMGCANVVETVLGMIAEAGLAVEDVAARVEISSPAAADEAALVVELFLPPGASCLAASCRIALTVSRSAG